LSAINGVNFEIRMTSQQNIIISTVQCVDGGFRLYMVRDITSLQEQSGTLSGPFEVGTLDG